MEVTELALRAHQDGWAVLSTYCKSRYPHVKREPYLAQTPLSSQTLLLLPTLPYPLDSYSHIYILRDKLLNDFIKFQKEILL